MTSFPSVLALAWTLAVGAAQAGSGPVVVELFSSQGCAACPPADRLVAELAQREDVLPLALHVDYWDYIGWADTFADPAFSRRQKEYARRAGRDMIYTPQMIVDGRDEIAGAKPMQLAEAIARGAAHDRRVEIEVSRQGGAVVARLTPRDGLGEGPFDVHIVQYAPLLQVEITRGENAGRRMDYANVVRDWRRLGRWDGTAPAEFRTQVDPGLRAAILVQRAGLGPIVAAARAD